MGVAMWHRSPFLGAFPEHSVLTTQAAVGGKAGLGGLPAQVSLTCESPIAPGGPAPLEAGLGRQPRLAFQGQCPQWIETCPCP